jgi:hypothetical protein
MARPWLQRDGDPDFRFVRPDHPRRFWQISRCRTLAGAARAHKLDPPPRSNHLGAQWCAKGCVYAFRALIINANLLYIGTAGYGNDTWAIGQSYSDDPILTPLVYDPKATAGKQWSSDGFSPSTVPRMYHSSATLLPDGD